jgi:hypothetical protein
MKKTDTRTCTAALMKPSAQSVSHGTERAVASAPAAGPLQAGKLTKGTAPNDCAGIGISDRGFGQDQFSDAGSLIFRRNFAFASITASLREAKRLASITSLSQAREEVPSNLSSDIPG